MSLATYKDLCIDAAAPDVMAAFWGQVLGLQPHHDDGDAYLTGPTDAHDINICRVPEPKTVKHRVHLDVHGASEASLQALGARVIDADSFRWVVMADPEGNEFCFFTRP